MNVHLNGTNTIKHLPATNVTPEFKIDTTLEKRVTILGQAGIVLLFLGGLLGVFLPAIIATTTFGSYLLPVTFILIVGGVICFVRQANTIKGNRKRLHDITSWVKTKYDMDVKKVSQYCFIILDEEALHNENVKRSLAALAYKKDYFGAETLFLVALQEIDGQLHLVNESGTPYVPAN